MKGTLQGTLQLHGANSASQAGKFAGETKHLITIRPVGYPGRTTRAHVLLSEETTHRRCDVEVEYSVELACDFIVTFRKSHVRAECFDSSSDTPHKITGFDVLCDR